MSASMFIDPQTLNDPNSPERRQLRARMNDLADRAKARFRASVRTIHGATANGEPEHIGSCVLLDLRGSKVLLTAAHVADWNATTTLYAGGGTGTVAIETPFWKTNAPNGRRDDDIYDFAATKLSDAAVAQIGDGFITEGDILNDLEIEPGHLYTVLGYPNSKHQKFDRVKRSIPLHLFSYSSTSRMDDKLAGKAGGEGKHHLFLSYQKHSKSEEGLKVSSIGPRGLSGGLIIDVGKPSDPRVYRDETCPVPKLAGMTIERWKQHQVLVGTRMFCIIPTLLENIGSISP